MLRNAAGRDVHVHITNYQDRYYGGGAMLRLYHFDLARNTIDVETISPWILEQEPERRNELEQREIELTDATNRFSLPIEFDARFAGFAPVTPRAPRGPAAVLTKGTVAYWRFDQGRADGTAVPDGFRITDLSGQGNHLERVTLPGSAPETLRWSAEHDGDQPAHASLFFDGGKKPARGAYLRTVDGAKINDATFPNGYTIEAFVKLPADVRSTNHAWMSIVSRFGAGADAGKTGGDPAEPIATLSMSDGMALQWAVFPLNQDGIATNWGHEMRAGEWFHVAVVNDGRVTHALRRRRGAVAQPVDAGQRAGHLARAVVPRCVPLRPDRRTGLLRLARRRAHRRPRPARRQVPARLTAPRGSRPNAANPVRAASLRCGAPRRRGRRRWR